MISTMPFGKFKGKLVSELPDDYLAWLVTIELRAPLRFVVDREILRRRYESAASAVTAEASQIAPAAESVRRRLSLSHHPDRGGSVLAMRMVNIVCDEILQEVGG